MLKTGKVKMTAKNSNTETPTFAFVEFEDTKSKAQCPGTEVFGCRLASEISTDSFPRSYFVEPGDRKAVVRRASQDTDASFGRNEN